MAKPIQHDTSKMSIGGALQTYLASVVETLVNTAIYEMCKLVDERTVFLKSLDLTEANEELKTQMQLGSEMMMAQFTSIMEDLGKEALTKIIELVNPMNLLLNVDNNSQDNKSPTSGCLSVMWKDKDHSYAHGRNCNKVPKKSTGKQTDRRESPHVTAISVSDELGQTDQEKEHSDDGHSRSSDVYPDELFDEQTDTSESPNLTSDSIMDDSGQIDGDSRNADVCPDEPLDDQTDQAESSFIIVMDDFGNLGRLVATQHLPVEAPCPLVSSSTAVTAGDLAGIDSSTGPQMSTVKSKPKSKSLQRKPAKEKRFVCEICGKAFMVLRQLNLHMNIHTGKKPFTCEACGKSFGNEWALKRHVTLHTGKQPYSCQECGKKFNYMNNLRRHRLTVHKGVKAFSCHICQEKFTQAHSLKSHLLIHTRQKPYRRRRTAGSVNMVAGKGFRCEECGKFFTQQTSLIVHRRMHSGERPFSCTQCHKSFSTEGNLRVHTRIHTGERPYSCDLCGKTFNQLAHLHTHKRYVHVRGKQFVCDKCGRMYVNPGNLKAHKCRYS